MKQYIFDLLNNVLNQQLSGMELSKMKLSDRLKYEAAVIKLNIVKELISKCLEEK